MTVPFFAHSSHINWHAAILRPLRYGEPQARDKTRRERRHSRPQRDAVCHEQAALFGGRVFQRYQRGNQPRGGFDTRRPPRPACPRRKAARPAAVVKQCGARADSKKIHRQS